MQHIVTLLAGGSSAPTTAQFTISVWWIFATGFFGALGLSTWKLLPWIIKRALDEKIDSKLLPMVTDVHKRIDEHMNTEENSFDALAETVIDLKTQLLDRNLLFDGLQATMDETRGVIAHHMTSDEQQFALSAEALAVGQQQLVERLERIETNTQRSE